MGAFTVNIEIGDIEGTRFESMDATVDTGASYPVVPRGVLESLGVEATERRGFVLAGKHRIELDVGTVLLRLGSQTHPVLAVFGLDTRCLLGTVTLSTFGLRADAARQLLVPDEGLLMSVVHLRVQF